MRAKVFDCVGLGAENEVGSVYDGRVDVEAFYLPRFVFRVSPQATRENFYCLCAFGLARGKAKGAQTIKENKVGLASGKDV